MNKPSKWFWVIAVIFLIWNALGCYLYILDVTMTEAQYIEMHGEVMEAARHFYPTWAVAAYAIAVWGGLLASILLLMRRGLSAMLFLVSLVAAVLCFIPVFVSGPLKDAGGSTFWVMPLVVVVIGLGEVWFSRREKAKGSLR